MTTYESNFIDWDKRRDEAAWEGFKYKNYDRYVHYLCDRGLQAEMSYFINNLSKKEKREACCIIVIKYSLDKKRKSQALKWYKKKGDSYDSEI